MKTNLDKLYKTDSSLEKEGIWFDISEEIAFKMKRFGGMNSPSVKAASAKYYQPYARMVKNGTLPAAKEKEIMVKTFVTSSIVDWKGIEIDGEMKDFNNEDCIKLLEGLPELTETLVAYSSEFEHFKEDLGNS